MRASARGGALPLHYPPLVAQVWEMGGDLRQHNAQNRDSWRRSSIKNPTCAKNWSYLRHESTERPPVDTQLVKCQSNDEIEVHFPVHLYELNRLIIK